MITKFIIEVARRADWREYSLTEYSTMEEAAHECLLNIPSIRLSFDAVRIKRVDFDEPTGTTTNSIIYHKLLSKRVTHDNQTHKDSTFRPESDATSGLFGRKGRGVYWVGGVIAVIIAALLSSYFAHNPTGHKDDAAMNANRPVGGGLARQSYIHHPAKGDPAEIPSLRKTIAPNDAPVNPSRILDQAQDVLSVLDGLDYLGCSYDPKLAAGLSEEFVKYVKRTAAPITDKEMAGELVEERKRLPNSDLKDRDKIFSEVGCDGLLDMAKLYKHWFQSHT